MQWTIQVVMHHSKKAKSKHFLMACMLLTHDSLAGPSYGGLHSGINVLCVMHVRHFVLLSNAPTIHPLSILWRCFPLILYAGLHAMHGGLTGLGRGGLHSRTDLLCLMCSAFHCLGQYPYKLIIDILLRCFPLSLCLIGNAQWTRWPLSWTATFRNRSAVSHF